MVGKFLIAFACITSCCKFLVAKEELILEDFSANQILNPDIVDLSIKLHIHSLWNNTVIQNWEHYRQAFENLKTSLPNLQIIRLSGGHSYHPKNGTIRQLRCDLLLVHNALDAITKQIQQLEIGENASASVNYTLFHFIDKEERFNAIEYQAVIDEVFGRNVILDQFSQNHQLSTFTLNYQLNGQQVKLEVSTFPLDVISQLKLDHGRLDLESKKWKEVHSKIGVN